MSQTFSPKANSASFSPRWKLALKSKTGAREGELIVFATDSHAIVNKVLGGLRVWFRDKLDLADKDMMAFAWVVDSPFFAWNEETKIWESEHHPFTMPKRSEE